MHADKVNCLFRGKGDNPKLYACAFSAFICVHRRLQLF